MKRSKFSEEQVVYAFRIAIAGSRSLRSRAHITQPHSHPRAATSSAPLQGKTKPLISIFHDVELYSRQSSATLSDE